jgi:DNA-binding MarR family transcriptional regulator
MIFADLGTLSCWIVFWQEFSASAPTRSVSTHVAAGRRLAALTYPALSLRRGDSPEPDTELTDDHMRLLEWLHQHPSGSLIAAAQKLGLDVTEVEALCADLVAAGIIERAREQ